MQPLRTRMHAPSLAQVYWLQKWTLSLGRNFRQRKTPVRNRKRGRSIVLEKDSLEVWFEGIQKGFLLERKGKIPCTGPEDGEGCLEGKKKVGWISGPACCWHSFSSPVHPGSFFRQPSAQTLLHCSYHHLVQLHALTSVCVLKILNIGSHTIVWTHADTAYCRSTHEGRMCLCRWQELKTAI